MFRCERWTKPKWIHAIQNQQQYRYSQHPFNLIQFILFVCTHKMPITVFNHTFVRSLSIVLGTYNTFFLLLFVLRCHFFLLPFYFSLYLLDELWLVSTQHTHNVCFSLHSFSHSVTIHNIEVDFYVITGTYYKYYGKHSLHGKK